MRTPVDGALPGEVFPARQTECARADAASAAMSA